MGVVHEIISLSHPPIPIRSGMGDGVPRSICDFLTSRKLPQAPSRASPHLPAFKTYAPDPRPLAPRRTRLTFCRHFVHWPPGREITAFPALTCKNESGIFTLINPQ